MPSVTSTARRGKSKPAWIDAGLVAAEAQVGVVREEAPVTVHEADAAGPAIVDVVEECARAGHHARGRVAGPLDRRQPGAARPHVDDLEDHVLEDARPADALDHPARPKIRSWTIAA